MKLTDEREMSRWAFNQCKNGNDTPEMRYLITKNWDAYHYCRWIKDRPEVRSKINDSFYVYLYCRFIKNKIN